MNTCPNCNREIESPEIDDVKKLKEDSNYVDEVIECPKCICRLLIKLKRGRKVALEVADD